ncbi:MAG TPA: tryptophan synthase subunit alpha [Phycisphaerales bacterium]|nr:tryptophan synthase subunit alpha [Phycisphaerales bacterium]
MNRVDRAFEEARRSQRRLLMPFICGGFPRPGLTGPLLAALERGGASIVEVGIPFSDPIADGPVIAGAMHRAIEAGTTPESIFEEVGAVRDTIGIGMVAMVSVTIVHRLGGREGFIERASEVGFDGLIIPDLPLEDSGAYRERCSEIGMTFSHLVAPTTPRDRATSLAKGSTGFVYLLARTGITGERTDAPDVAERVAGLRRSTDLPIACGFGVSTPEHVRAVVAHADAAIVGSAVVRRLDRAIESGGDPVEAAEAFTRELATGLAGPPG